MRITIETSDAESRYTTVSQDIGGQQITGQSTAQEAQALDGGPPPDALLSALGAQTEVRTEGTTGPGGATDAGAPPSWLTSIEGGKQ